MNWNVLYLNADRLLFTLTRMHGIAKYSSYNRIKKANMSEFRCLINAYNKGHARTQNVSSDGAQL